MKISVNTIQKLNKDNGSVADPTIGSLPKLVERIGAQLGGVEEVTPIWAKYNGALIVTVVSCDDHPNADRLHVCMIDDGGVAHGVDRNENGLVQVVCGAPNVKAGVNVVWLPPNVTVPSSYDDDPFVLEARELRGVVSNGMLASPKELAIGDSHEGLLIVDGPVSPGTAFAAHYNLAGDEIIDIENKMFTHRPDCFGWLGVAREIAGIQGQAYKSPDWYRADMAVPSATSHDLPLEVQNEIPELVPRFMAVPMANITIGPSPVWLQTDLARVGVRPINNIVDLTNYYMLLTGQPLHAYDYDKVKALDGADHTTIVVRNPHYDEKLTLLNGKDVTPRKEAIVIATETQAIGLGGVMGGGNTEVDEGTTNIILECASFNMYSIRKTSMSSGVFTDAVTRFNKGQSPLQNAAVLSQIIKDIQAVCGGQVAGEAIDLNHLPVEVQQRGSLYLDVVVSRAFINSRLGLQLTTEDMSRLLTNVEFSVTTDGDNLTVRAPFWRTDIEIAEDVVEEVGRLYGFDKLPLELPQRIITPAPKNSLLETKKTIRHILSSAGAHELLTYSFVHGNLLDTVGHNRDHAYKLSNALSPDLQYYRLSITPSLLEKVNANIRAGYGEFALFEFGKAHIKGERSLDEPAVPGEKHRLAFVYAADTKNWATEQGAVYYQANEYLMRLVDTLGLSRGKLRLVPLHGSFDAANAAVDAWVAPYARQRSALVMYTLDGAPNGSDTLIGVIGEYKPSVVKALKLPQATAGFELDTLLLQLAARQNVAGRYTQLPKYPSLSQDISLKVSREVTYQQVYDCIWQALQAAELAGMLPRLTPLDIYQRQDDAEHKQITLRLTVASYEKTLVDAEVARLLDTAAAAAADQFDAERL